MPVLLDDPAGMRIEQGHLRRIPEVMVRDRQQIRPTGDPDLPHEPAAVSGLETSIAKYLRGAQVVLPSQPAPAVETQHRSTLARVFRDKTDQHLFVTVSVDVRDQHFVDDLAVIFRVEGRKGFFPVEVTANRQDLERGAFQLPGVRLRTVGEYPGEPVDQSGRHQSY